MKVITIGRSGECSVVVNDVKVSRVHAQLVQSDNGNISVVDLGSTNGTMVNGKRIVGEMRLNPGDELRVGDTVLPWQKYIATMPSQTFQPMASNTQSPTTVVGENAVGMPASQPGDKKSKNTLLWIILAVVLGLLVTGGVVWLLLGRGPEGSSTHDSFPDSSCIIDTTEHSNPADSYDSIRLSQYEKYLQKLFREKQLALSQQNQHNQNNNSGTSNVGPADSLDNVFYNKISSCTPRQIYYIYKAMVTKQMLTADAQYASFEHNDELYNGMKTEWSKEIIDCYNAQDKDKKNAIIKIVNRY